MKTKTIVHKSAVPIYAAAAVWLVYALLFPLYQVGHFLLAAAVSAAAALIARLFCKDVTEVVELPEEPVTTGNPALDKMIADGDGAIKTMRALNDSIQDETISRQIDRLEEVSSRIFQYVKDNPAKLPQIRKFMSYYLPYTIQAYMKRPPHSSRKTSRSWQCPSVRVHPSCMRSLAIVI